MSQEAWGCKGRSGTVIQTLGSSVHVQLDIAYGEQDEWFREGVLTSA